MGLSSHPLSLSLALVVVVCVAANRWIGTPDSIVNAGPHRRNSNPTTLPNRPILLSPPTGNKTERQ